MLKMYHGNSQQGGSSAFWEETWNDGGLEEAIRFCEVDPLRPLFELYAPPGSLMLEGGCGRGQYVAFYSDRGISVIGLDFARDALRNLQSRNPNLALCAGNVADLPFRDEAFDVYYSGGVVEHFESGADSALREARRVLRPGGILLISVPYINPLRRLVSLVKKSDRRWVSKAGLDDSVTLGSRRFFQYAYSKREFQSLLGAAGFDLISTKGYSIIWGLYELPFINMAVQALAHRRGGPTGTRNGNAKGVNDPLHENRSSPSKLKRLIIGEDDSVPVAGLAVKPLRWTCANMMMYVCRR